MPEYLAPGVYVEEVPTGSRPIEGVSTSTAGMVGVTERGPVGVPMLVTSYGEYERIFGGELPETPFGPNRHLPFAVAGFFANGGKRLFVVRVLEDAAARAHFTLHDRGAAGGIATRLLRPVPEGGGDAAAPVLVLDGGAFAGVAPDQPFRIGDGSAAEYRLVDTGAAATAENHVPLHLPLGRTHDAGTSVRHIPRSFDAFPTNPLRVDGDVDRGADQLELTGDANDVAALAEGDVLQIGDNRNGEYRRVVSRADIDPTHVRVDLAAPLHLDHESNEDVRRVDVTVSPVDPAADTTLDERARAGDAVALVAAKGTFFDVVTDLVVFDWNGDPEVRRIGDLHELTLRRAAGERLPAGTVAEDVGVADAAGAAGAARALTRAAGPGDRAVALDNRENLAEGDVLRIGIGGDAEYVTVESLPERAAAGPDPGNAVLATPVRLEHGAGDEVVAQDVTMPGNRPATVTLFDAGDGAVGLPIPDGTGYTGGDLVRLTTPAGEVFFVTVADADDLDPDYVPLVDPMENAHPAGSPVVERDEQIRVEALDAGGWGNRLRVSVEDEEDGLLAPTPVQTLLPPRQLRLESYAGVERGTVLEFSNPATGDRIGDRAKVVHVDRTDGTITLQAPLPAPITALPPGADIEARSREFALAVRLYQRPDPAVPSRSDTVIASERFRWLSMDPRHSHYVETVVGAPDSPLRRSDRRPEGASRFIRVGDLGEAGGDPVLHSVRLGPEALTDRLPSGEVRPARHPLREGTDAVGTITSNSFLGEPGPDPEDRTGLESLRNVESISIVAVPGQVGPAVQSGLITHCERMRYRFAVLDGPAPAHGDSLRDAQLARQRFDTRYAALYHPWPLIAEPFPARLDEVPLIPVPPSGHVIGLYARTDVERGVHKAPANEVLRGVQDLSRKLSKSEQDLLNPAPKNINVIRDFREDFRGIRVWGARVITSDPDYKYVPVRRLLIFLEQSIEQGLQWVVFEPNAEPLWDRVRRSISSFLRVVWRNGALEGVVEEQAFVVKCDRTTMTQADIDNGRLICLVAVAPVKPAEYVIIRIGLKTAEAES